MNSLIKKLAFEAYAKDAKQHDPTWEPNEIAESLLEDLQPIFEEFHRLVMLECTKVLATEMDRLDSTPGREVSAQAFETAQVLIKNHFGV